MNPVQGVNNSFGQVDDVNAAAKLYVKRHRKVAVILIGFCVIFGVAMIGAFLGTRSVFFIQLALVPVAVLFAGYALIRNQAEHVFMQQFAAQNNFTYTAREYGVPALGSAFLAHTGSDQSLQDVVAGTSDNHPLRLYNFTYYIQSGKNREKVEFTVFELEHTGNTLDVLVVSRAHATAAFSGLFLGKKKLDISDGDFDKYFTLYVPEGFETETLEILTPDIMQELVAQSAQFSFEFSGNKVFIFNKQMVTNKTQLETMYSFSDTLINQLAPVLATFKSQQASA